MATLNVAIDARRAKTGAREFNEAANSMKTQAANTTSKIERSVQSAMRGFMALASAGGALYTMRSIVRSASDAQETLSKFNVVFRDQAREVAAWAEDFGDKVGRAIQDVERWLAGLQDLFVPLGFARDRAAELSENLVKLAVDVASFNNRADADVINDFTSALVGQTETVRKYGIIISEATLRQEALNQGWQKSYKDLTDLEKVQLRYSIIQNSTTDAQGDAVRTADSYANQIKRLSAEWTELKVLLGEPVMNALTGVVSAVNDNSAAWKNFFEIIAEGTQELIRLPETLRTVQEALAGPSVYEQMPMKGWKALTPIGMVTNLLGAYELKKKLQTPIVDEQGFTYPPGTPIGTLDISPRSAQHLAEMRARARVIREFAEFQGPLSGTEYQWERPDQDIIEKAAGLERKTAEERLQTKLRMYEDMKRYDNNYYEAQKQLLALQRDEYAHTSEDKVLAHEWYADQVTRLEQDLHERNAMIVDQDLSLWERAMQRRKEITEQGLGELSALEAQQMDIMMRFQDQSQYGFIHMWDGFIAGSESAKDAVLGFFGDFFLKLAQAHAQIMMLKLWEGFAGPGLMGFAGMTFPSAMGNVFDHGRIVPFGDGGIFTSPTYFPLANGKIGLAGEVPEAAVPLKRMISGKLGIESSGTPVVNVSPTPVKIILVKNEHEATIEAMRSSDGQAATIANLRDFNIL